MCFGLPVIVSDQVGAANDLVMDGYNGYTFPDGDMETLASTLQSLMKLPEEQRLAMGMRSSRLIKDWLRKDLGHTLERYLDGIYSGKAGQRQ